MTEVVKFVTAAVITEEERRTLGQALAIIERLLVNAKPVVELLPPTIEVQLDAEMRGKLRLNGRTEP